MERLGSCWTGAGHWGCGVTGIVATIGVVVVDAADGTCDDCGSCSWIVRRRSGTVVGQRSLDGSLRDVLADGIVPFSSRSVDRSNDRNCGDDGLGWVSRIRPLVSGVE